MKLTAQDIQNAQIFLNRVDIKGNEAMPMAELQMKLQQIANDMQQQAAPPAPPAPKEPIVKPPSKGKN